MLPYEYRIVEERSIQPWVIEWRYSMRPDAEDTLAPLA
jgi:hypothetical protein